MIPYSDFLGQHEVARQSAEPPVPLEDTYKLVPGEIGCHAGLNVIRKGLMKLDIQKLKWEAESFAMPPRFLNTATKLEIARWVACA